MRYMLIQEKLFLRFSLNNEGFVVKWQAGFKHELVSVS